MKTLHRSDEPSVPPAERSTLESQGTIATRLETALEHHQTGALGMAERLYAGILAEEPRHFSAMHCLGVLRNQQGNHEAAALIIAEALQINPRSALAHLNLGIALWKSHRPEEALAHYHYCLVLDPGNSDALLNRSAALRALGRHVEALGCLDRLLAAHPGSTAAHANRGIVLLDLMRFEDALSSLDQAIALQPGSGEAHVARGDALIRLGRSRDAIESYARALPLVDEPYLLNKKINELETELGQEELLSFPPQVFLNFNQLCNARCIFCHMPEPRSGFKDALEPGDLERMTWLRYVSDLALVGGFGETLINPFFQANLAFLRETHPHLRLCLWTNGISITEELCTPLAEGLNSLVVSLNAATASTWEQVMGGTRGFERICDRLKTISAIKARRGTGLPKISISTVLLQENVHELPALVDLARELGVEEVLAQHYSTHEPSAGRTIAPASSSMYQDPERCDHFLREATSRARVLGIRTDFPLPFAADSEAIQSGTRVDHPPAPCQAPWGSLLLFDELQPGLRQASVCCTGPFYLAVYRKEELSETGLRALWNHPNLRFLRKTIHGKGRNPVCDWCRGNDRFDPADDRWEGIRRAVEPEFKRLDTAYRAGAPNVSEQVVEAMGKL